MIIIYHLALMIMISRIKCYTTFIKKGIDLTG
jgi:hypothetical protein